MHSAQLALDAAIARIGRLQALAESALQSLPLGVLLCDPQGRVVGANHTARAWLAWPARAADPGSWRGTPLAYVLARAQRQGGASPTPPARWPHWLAPLLGEYLTPAGRHLQLLAAPVVSGPELAGLADQAPQHAQGAQADEGAQDAGRPSGFIVVLADLSSERAAQRQRESWNRLLSHDLRSPQVSIASLLELDEGRSISPALAGAIQREVSRTLWLAEQFLNVSHAWGGQYRLQPTHVASLLLDVHDQVWALATRAQVGLRLRIDEGAEQAYALLDAPLLTRALVNLLSNAIDHSLAGGEVQLCLASAGETLVLALADRGRGMPPAQLQRMLGGGADDGAPGGHAPGPVHADGRTRSHGLGFEFARTVIVRHGGHLEGWSAPQAGCTLLIHLPLDGGAQPA